MTKEKSGNPRAAVVLSIVHNESVLQKVTRLRIVGKDYDARVGCLGSSSKSSLDLNADKANNGLARYFSWKVA
jgi:hypothetical protein